MLRTIRSGLLACLVLAPMACATQGGLVDDAAEPYDDPPDAVATPAAVPATMPATQAATASPMQPATTPTMQPGTTPPTTRPAEPALSATEIASLQLQAEDAYRARRIDEALGLYERVVESQPANAHAWLRLGNVHHQRRDWFKALAAYRRASARTLADVENEPAVRAKAFYNIALIELQLARRSLRSLERLGEASSAVGDPAPLAREIERTQQRLEAVFVREPAAARPVAAPGARGAGATPSAASRADDRPPKVDYIRGEPKP